MAHDHAHPGGHDHGPSTEDGGRALGWALGANGVLLVAQVAVGLVAGSLAVLADAVHQGTDVLALALAFVALRLARRPARGRYTYGYRQVETLAATVNGLLLASSAAWVVVEAVDRLGQPADIDGGLVLAIGLVGLGVNGWGAVSLSRHATGANLAAAGWHLATDAAGSAGVVVVGAVAALGAGGAAAWIDPGVSLAIAAAAAWAAVGLVVRGVRTLLAAAPAGIDLDAVERTIRGHPRVDDLHHLHVWAIGDRDVALSAHVVVGEELSLHQARQVADELETALADQRITHATLQVECHACD